MTINRALTVLLTVVMLLAPIGGAVGSVGATSPALDATEVQPSASGNLPGDFVNASENVDVWERAVRPLRLDRSDDASGIATSVDSMNVIVEGSGGSSFLRDSANRNMVVYRDDATADISFDLGEAGATDEIDGDSVHLIAAKAESPDDPELPSSTDIQTLRDFVRDEADNENIIFENASTKSVNSDLADFSYDFSGSNRGAGGYVFMAVYTESGQGVNINNGNLSVDGSVSVLGADTATVQETSSTIEPVGDNYDPGDNITFDVNANLATDDNRVEHVVALWNESNVANEKMRIIAPDDISSDTKASDFTVNHSIKSVSGVQNVEDDASAFGRTLSENRRSDVYELADIVSFLANEGNISEPQTNRVEPNTVVNASATSINATGSNVDITVETVDSFNTGEYVAVHMAIADGDLTKVSSSRTDITLGGGGGDSGDGGDGSDGGDGGDTRRSSGSSGSSTPTPEPVTNVVGNAQVSTLTSGQSVIVAISGASAGDSVETTFDQETTNRDLQQTGAGFIGLTKRFAADSDFTATVTYSRDNPSPAAVPNLQESVGAYAFGHINVEHSASDDALEDVTFQFSVRQDQLEERGITAEDVSLYRYNNAEWEEYQATVEDVGDDRVTFSAVSPGLSTFAIGQSSTTLDDGTDGTDGTDDGDSTDSTDDGDSTDSTDGTDGGDGGDGDGSPPVAIVAVLLVLAVVVAIGLGVYQSRQE